VQIDLKQLDGEPRDFRLEVEVPEQRLDHDEVRGAVRVRLQGSVRRDGSSYQVSGSVAADGSVCCARCLDPVPWKIEEPFAVRLVPEAESASGEGEVALEENELDVAFVRDHQLDLEELAAEQVVLALPMKILCTEDCAGLCPRCGLRLGGAPDGCRCEAEPDSRWGPLLDLQKKNH
jgi:uncharacterized protein